MLPREKIRVILVEDSGFMRILISEMLRKDAALDLIATATNGKEGVEKAREMKPDVVVTDMVMPEYDGLYVVKELASGKPTPVILLSTLERSHQQVFEALQSGAFDFVDKPRDRFENNEGSQYSLIPLIKAAAQSRPVTVAPPVKNFSPHTFDDRLNYDIIVVGSSTGGPGAVEFILDNLPRNISVPIVIAQHMPERFIETFAERLNAKKIFNVRVAFAGEEPKPGYVYLAGGTQNLKLIKDPATDRFVFGYTGEQFKEFNHPSIDCLFESIAHTYGSRAIAIVLTGMGRDGTSGMLKIRQRGGYTIAQDESTSVVYGMPKAAAEAGAVTQVLKLHEIPGFVVSCLS
jgi:two-component system, chemotaxis family, protein-glutamate methylesterase/glutaminase